MGLLTPRTATVLVYQGDDAARLAELYRAVLRAETRVEEAKLEPARSGDELPTSDAEKAAYDAAVDVAAERALEVVVTTIGPQRFRKLLSEHPPRTEVVDELEQVVEDDQEYHLNTETFPRALLAYRDEDRPDIRTISEPHVDLEQLLEFLDNEISDGDFERLWNRAYLINASPGADDALGKFSPGTADSPAT